jgi:hypothetical protein
VTSLKNVPASIRQRLFNLAKKQGVDFQRMLVRYAIERLLCRLSQHSAGDRFVLKGAMLFITWPERTFRPTGDLDLLGSGSPDPDSIKQLFLEICGIDDTSDGTVFDLTSIAVEAVREDEIYQGVRIVGDARLDSAVIKMQIDVGFGDKVYPSPKRISFPCLLPNMRAAEILAYPPETVIAEKFEAMIRYGGATSRLKDFFDIWTIAKTFGFEKAALAQAIGGTLHQRGTGVPTEMPLALTPVFAELPETKKMWEAFLRRNPPAVAPPSFEELVSDIRQFLGPVLGFLELPEGAVGAWHPNSGWSE